MARSALSFVSIALVAPFVLQVFVYNLPSLGLAFETVEDVSARLTQVEAQVAQLTKDKARLQSKVDTLQFILGLLHPEGQ
jgi:uncharacterized protein YoxC